MNPPPFLGGQGRSAESIRDTGSVLFWIAAIGIVAVTIAGLWAES